MNDHPDNTALAGSAGNDAAALAVTLRVTEIFFSLQGETSRTGLPTVFIRLTGCPLRCGYCDTAYAFHGGAQLTLAAVLQAPAQYRTRYVTDTSRDAHAQKSRIALLEALHDCGYSESLQTCCALDV